MTSARHGWGKQDLHVNYTNPLDNANVQLRDLRQVDAKIVAPAATARTKLTANLMVDARVRQPMILRESSLQQQEQLHSP